MLHWFVDNAVTVCILLGLAAAGMMGLWWTTRRGAFIVTVGVVVVLIGLLIALSSVIVTDRGQVRANIRAMRDAALANDAAGVLRHISRDFQHGDAKALVQRAVNAMAQHRVQDIVLWDFDFEVPPDRTKRALVAFRARALTPTEEGWYLVRTEFVFEDGQWRMRDIQLFNPIVDTRQPIPLP